MDYNFGFQGNGHPLLRRKFVREAIARGLNRAAIVRTVFGRILPGINIPVLNSGVIMSTSKYYKQHWGKYAHNPRTAGHGAQRLPPRW